MEPRARLVQALACAAITPGLRTVLVFDATPEQLESIARLLGRLLQRATGHEPARAALPASDDEDVLWGHYGISRARQGNELVWRSGPFEPSPTERAPRLITVPDLARLGLSSVRAAVALVGAEVAELQRHGQGRRWQPELCWVAACARQDRGKLSPHLLDRFALRLDAAGLEPLDSMAALDRALRGESAALDPLDRVAEPYLRSGALAKALRRRPAMGRESLRRVLAYFPPSGGPPKGARRELALARLAEALARLEAKDPMTPAHVDEAAALVGLLAPEVRAGEREAARPPPTARKSEPEVPPRESRTAPAPSVPMMSERAEPAPNAPIHPPGEAQVVPGGAVPAPPATGPGDPYPEDTAPVERAAESLKPPARRRTAGLASRRGTVVGVTPARDLGDLALTATLLEAAKYQAIRRKHRPEARGLLLSEADLRGHLRAPPPDFLLVLVVDHTALAGWEWGTAVLPYLKEAYVQRAAVCVVQVGAADAEHELSARRVVSRNALAPEIYRALASGRGKATPLAHGLELALETLRHALRHGRGTATHARLVVITDGRGNVPLEASHLRRLPPVIRDEGVRDALAAAERLRQLGGKVEAVLVQPRPRFYPELTSSLATALGAQLLAPRKEGR